MAKLFERLIYSKHTDKTTAPKFREMVILSKSSTLPNKKNVYHQKESVPKYCLENKLNQGDHKYNEYLNVKQKI